MPAPLDAQNSTSASDYAEVFGSPGTRVRMAGLLRTQWPLLVVVIIAGYLLRAALPWPPIGSSVAGALFLVLAVGVAAAANHSRHQLQAFLKGAKGEEMVARTLALLPGTFSVFHSVPARLPAPGGADMDHVVVGPTGIFVVETKNWSGLIAIQNGELTCDGEPPSRPPLEQVKAAATALRSRLQGVTKAETTVTPVLCFASNRLTDDPQGAAGVVICSADSLATVIMAPTETLLAEADRQLIAQTLQADCEP
jgi:hypothetical protein